MIEVTSLKHSGVRNKLEKHQDGGNKFFLNNLSSNTKYTVALRRQSGDSLRSGLTSVKHFWQTTSAQSFGNYMSFQFNFDLTNSDKVFVAVLADQSAVCGGSDWIFDAAAVKQLLINGYNFGKRKISDGLLKLCNPEYTFFSEAQILSVETLVLPAEMVAESVVNSIQTNSFDADEDDSNPLIQASLALISMGIFPCL